MLTLIRQGRSRTCTWRGNDERHGAPHLGRVHGVDVGKPVLDVVPPSVAHIKAANKGQGLIYHNDLFMVSPEVIVDVSSRPVWMPQNLI